MRDVLVRNKKEKISSIPIPINLNEQEKLQYLLFRDLVYEKEEKTRSMISVNLSELVSSPNAFIRSLKNRKYKYHQIEDLWGENFLFKRKYGALMNEIKKTKKRIKNKKVIVVYCRFLPTLDLLEKQLKGENLKIFRLDGTVRESDRKPKLTELTMINSDKTIKPPVIFLVSQVGNEGLDFDKFSNTIIHFDGHYNPAVIDQRNGRIYRGTNTARSIKVKHILLDSTYDQRIKFIESEKRKMKDFYLGDASLDQLFEKTAMQDPKKKKELLNKLRFIIDLEPKRKWLLPELRKNV
jgi:SNF2 family DNA or RNA helicase